MSDTTDPLAWVARAEEDFSLARLALRQRPPLTYGVCFHAQQCAEKYLKAILVARGQEFPKIHDLLALSDLCTKAGILLELDPDLLDTLSSYAVRVRYPGEEPLPEEARAAVETAKVVRRLARSLLGLQERKGGKIG
jgi:HEPN domain-containing protein